MNIVAPSRCESARSASVNSAGRVNSWPAPRPERTAGRGRSVGSSSGVRPSKRSRQYSSWPSSTSPRIQYRWRTAKSAYWIGSGSSGDGRPRLNAR